MKTLLVFSFILVSVNLSFSAQTYNACFIKEGIYYKVPRTITATTTNNTISAPASKLASTKLSNSDIVKILIENLLQGPTAAEIKQGIKSDFPTETKIVAFSLQNEKLSIDFSRELVTGGIDEEQIQNIHKQIQFTLLDFPEITSFKLTVGNKSLGYYIPEPKPAPGYKPAPVVQPVADQSVAVQPAIMAAPGKPLLGKKISVSPGHGWWYHNWGTSPYYIWMLQREVDYLGSGYNEDTVNWQIINRLFFYLVNAGAAVYPCREMDTNAGNDTDTGISGKYPNNPNKPWYMMAAKYYERHRGAPQTVTDYTTNENSCDWRSRPYYSNWLQKEGPGMDIHFSHHCNAISDTSVRGSAMFIDKDTDPNDTTDYNGDNMQEHADNINNSLNLANKIKARFIVRVRQYDSTWVMRSNWEGVWGYAEARFSQKPSCFIENGFYTNVSDRTGLINATFQDLCGKGIYEGICDYFGVTPEFPTGGVITGIVKNTSSTSIPPPRSVFVASATITASQGGQTIATATSDIIGNYFLIQLAAGTYDLTVSAPSYATQNVTGVSVTNGQISFRNFTLSVGPPTTGVLAGTVTKSGSTTPVANATVTVKQSGQTKGTTISGSNGTYSVTLTSGTYDIEVTSYGYISQTQSGKIIVNGQTTTVDFSLVAIFGTLAGKVTNSSTGLPVKGAVCTISPGAQISISDTNGNYSFNNLSTGTYTISVSSLGYQSNTGAGTVVAGQTTTVNITLISILPTTGSISGKVTIGTTGNPVTSANCVLNPGGRITITDSNGNYSFNTISTGSYTVSVTATGYNPNSGIGTVTGGQTTTINVALTPIGSTIGQIVGKITDITTGLPVTGAVCTLSSNGQTTITDINGNYSFNDLTPAAYTISVSSTGYQTNTGAGTIVAGQDTTINVLLTRNGFSTGQISGRVTEFGVGYNITGATVTLQGSDLQLDTVTDNNGNYSFIALSQYSGYNVFIYAEGYSGESRIVSVTGGVNTLCDFVLSRNGGDLYGIITNENTLTTVNSAICQLTPGNKQALSNATGQYYFYNLPVGNYSLTVLCDGYEISIPIEVVITTGAKIEKNVLLKPIPTLSTFDVSRTVFTPAASNNNKVELTFNVDPANSNEINGELKIFDLRGRMIRKIMLNDISLTQINHSKITTWWDGKNDAGESVNSGVYFYQLEVDGQVKTGKVVVAR